MNEKKIEEVEIRDKIDNPDKVDSNTEFENLYVEVKETIDELKILLTTFHLKQNHEKDGTVWLTSSQAQNCLNVSRTTLKRISLRSKMRRIELSKRRFLYHKEDVEKISDKDFK